MKKYLRFRDLKERGVVNSWPALKRKVEREGFPEGPYDRPQCARLDR